MDSRARIRTIEKVCWNFWLPNYLKLVLDSLNESLYSRKDVRVKMKAFEQWRWEALFEALRDFAGILESLARANAIQRGPDSFLLPTMPTSREEMPLTRIYTPSGIFTVGIVALQKSWSVGKPFLRSQHSTVTLTTENDLRSREV